MVLMCLRNIGFKISERTVGDDMKELGIKAHYVKPWTTTMRNSNYDNQLRNSLKEQFNPSQPNTA